MAITYQNKQKWPLCQGKLAAMQSYTSEGVVSDICLNQKKTEGRFLFTPDSPFGFCNCPSVIGKIALNNVRAAVGLISNTFNCLFFYKFYFLSNIFFSALALSKSYSVEINLD